MDSGLYSTKVHKTRPSSPVDSLKGMTTWVRSCSPPSLKTRSKACALQQARQVRTDLRCEHVAGVEEFNWVRRVRLDYR